MDSNPAPEHQPVNPQPAAPAPAPAAVSHVSNTGSGFAIAALVLGIIAFIFGWTGLFNLVTGILAVVFGIVALKKGQSKGMSIAGLVLGGIGLLTSIIFSIIFFAALANTDTTSTDDNSAGSSNSSKTDTAKWDIDGVYDKVTTGMTKAEVEAAVGKKSTSCSSFEDPTLGKSETCSYGNSFTDGGSISVTYGNDAKVTTKFKYKN